ncbi:MAG: hypothetical protein JJ900_16690 [Rhodospirillales bacterium]|nr:hypothetical protein [Rhodospirillales bacterium]MBO6788488.1 hypothetical protein [Rhodospirillales bacterium]
MPRSVSFLGTLLILVLILHAAIAILPLWGQFGSTVNIGSPLTISRNLGDTSPKDSIDAEFISAIEAVAPNAIVGIGNNSVIAGRSSGDDVEAGQIVMSRLGEHNLTWPRADELAGVRVRIADVRCCGRLMDIPFYISATKAGRYRFSDRPKQLGSLHEVPPWTFSLIPEALAQAPSGTSPSVDPKADKRQKTQLPPVQEMPPPETFEQKSIPSGAVQQEAPPPVRVEQAAPNEVILPGENGRLDLPVPVDQGEPIPKVQDSGAGEQAVPADAGAPDAAAAPGESTPAEAASPAALPTGTKSRILYDYNEVAAAVVRTVLNRAFADGRRNVVMIERSNELSDFIAADPVGAHLAVFESIRRFGAPRTVTFLLEDDTAGPDGAVPGALVRQDVLAVFERPLALPEGGFGEPQALPAGDVAPADVFNAAVFTEDAWTTVPYGTLFGGFLTSWFLAAGLTARRRDGATAGNMLTEIFRQRAPSLSRLAVVIAFSAPLIAAAWWFIGQVWWLWPASGIGTVPGLAGMAGLFAVVLGLVQYRVVMSRNVSEVLEGVMERFRTAFFRDVPLTHVADDRLGHAKIAHSLATFLMDADTRPPLVVAVNGPWGGGKSSVMGMLDSELRETGAFRSIWFNAWRYDKEEHILAALLQTMAASLRRDVGPMFWLRISYRRFREGTLIDRVVILTAFALVTAYLFAPGSLTELMSIADTVAQKGKLSFLTASEEDDARIAVAGLGGLTAGAAAVAWIWGFLRLITPFRLPFKKLAKLENYGDRVGFIGEFAREFQRYRDAIGRDRKFVVFIDDLDRCPPDKVVEVLKTINLVINSGVGADRTIFVLGYDRAYVRDCVQHHFREFLQTANSADTSEDFGNRYLKKMVTLSVSVPLPERSQILNMLSERESASETPRGGVGRRLNFAGFRNAGIAILGYLKPFWPLPLIFFYIVYFLGAAPEKTGEKGTGGSGENPDPITPPEPVPDTPRLDEVYPVLTLPPDIAPDWLAWSILATAIFALAGAHLAALSEDREKEKKAADYKGPFIDHLKRWESLLPDNPRDAVRLINALRVGNEIEVQGKAKTLGEADMTLLLLLAFKKPDLFDPEKSEDGVLQKIRGLSPKGVPQDDKIRGLLADEFPDAVDFDADTIRIFADADKVARFMELHRFCLDTVNGKQKSNS